MFVIPYHDVISHLSRYITFGIHFIYLAVCTVNVCFFSVHKSRKDGQSIQRMHNLGICSFVWKQILCFQKLGICKLSYTENRLLCKVSEYVNLYTAHYKQKSLCATVSASLYTHTNMSSIVICIHPVKH